MDLLIIYTIIFLIFSTIVFIVFQSFKEGRAHER